MSEQRSPYRTHKQPIHHGAHRLDQVFHFIVEYKRANDGNSPTVREIALAMDGTSTSVIAYLLKRLEQSGRIRHNGRGSARQIQVVGGVWTLG